MNRRRLIFLALVMSSIALAGCDPSNNSSDSGGASPDRNNSPAATSSRQPSTGDERTPGSAARNANAAADPQQFDRDARLAKVVADIVADAHGLQMWRSKTAMQCKLVVEAGGRTIFDGTMTVQTNIDRVRLQATDGTIIGFDGEKAWIHPADAALENPRAHVRLWSFLAAAPFKLVEGNAAHSKYQPRYIGADGFDSIRLTFHAPPVSPTAPAAAVPPAAPAPSASVPASAAAHAPAEWFIAYSHPRSHRLHALAWPGPHEAFAKVEGIDQNQPLSVVFSNPQVIDGVALPSAWEFHTWDEAMGVQGEPVARATISDIQFFRPQADAFTMPEGAEEITTTAK